MLSDQQYVRHSIEFNLFFLRIAKEYAIFAAASLPPRDRDVVQQLLGVKNAYEALLEKTMGLEKKPQTLPAVTRESIARVTELRNFKHQRAVGILECQIRSIIPPLQSDHMLREVTHYLRLLKSVRS